MYKIYVRPHLDYGDVIYHNQSLESMDLLEAVQYQAALIVTGCWKGTSRDKLYAELGWESLKNRRHFRRLSLYYKIKNNLAPKYLVSLARPYDQNHTTRFNNSYFPYCYKACDNLGEGVRTFASLQIFKKKLLDDIRSKPRSTFNLKD